MLCQYAYVLYTVSMSEFSHQIDPEVLRVNKFGGSSMAQPEVVADLVSQVNGINVVSAPGKRNPEERKVTDVLLTLGDAVVTHDMRTAQESRDEVVARFESIYSDLGSVVHTKLKDELAHELRPIKFLTNREFYAPVGELMGAKYFAELAGGQFVEPHIIFRNGELDRAQTFHEIVKARDRNELGKRDRPAIIPGFFGYDGEGGRITLGRGGSDRTGALYAVALGIDYENWTDVDGIYSGDPRVVLAARVIAALTRDEVREGAHGGSGVLQGDTIDDLQGSSIGVRVRNTFKSSAPGTVVTPNRSVDMNCPVMAVAGRMLSEVTIHDLGMANRQGYIAGITDVVSDQGLSIEHMPMSQDRMTSTFAGEVEREVLRTLQDELRTRHAVSPQAEVEVQNDKGVVYVVGQALADRTIANPVLGETLTLLNSNNIYVDAPVAHRDSPALAFIMDGEDVEAAQKLIHAHYVG